MRAVSKNRGLASKRRRRKTMAEATSKETEDLQTKVGSLPRPEERMRSLVLLR